jgi:hypothetical protein
LLALFELDAAGGVASGVVVADVVQAIRPLRQMKMIMLKMVIHYLLPSDQK